MFVLPSRMSSLYLTPPPPPPPLHPTIPQVDELSFEEGDTLYIIEKVTAAYACIYTSVHVCTLQCLCVCVCVCVCVRVRVCVAR